MSKYRNIKWLKNMALTPEKKEKSSIQHKNTNIIFLSYSGQKNEDEGEAEETESV